MSPLLSVVVVVALVTIAAGTFFSLRWFTRAAGPPVEVKPKRQPHDAATVAQLKQFFDGKSCAACSRPIPPMHVGEPHPGLMHAETHETLAWEDIPAANLPRTLASHTTLCPSCATVETFRRQFPERVVDRHRPFANPSS